MALGLSLGLTVLAPKPRVGICWDPTFVGKREDPPKEGVLLFIPLQPSLEERGPQSETQGSGGSSRTARGNSSPLFTSRGAVVQAGGLSSGNQEDVPHQEAGRGAEGIGPAAQSRRAPVSQIGHLHVIFCMCVCVYSFLIISPSSQ